MYKVVIVDGWLRVQIDVSGKPNKYGKPKAFPTKTDAQNYINKRSYKGMRWKYEIVLI